MEETRLEAGRALEVDEIVLVRNEIDLKQGSVNRMEGRETALRVVESVDSVERGDCSMLWTWDRTWSHLECSQMYHFVPRLLCNLFPVGSQATYLTSLYLSFLPENEVTA